MDTPDHHYNVAKVLPRLITEIRTMANYTGHHHLIGTYSLNLRNRPRRLPVIMDPPRFDHWYQFGCLVYVFDESQRDKTKARGIAAVYIGTRAESDIKEMV